MVKARSFPGAARARKAGLLALLAGAVLLPAGAAMAAPRPVAVVAAQDTQAGLLAAEDRLFAAQASRDLAGIARGFAEEALFMHANGMAQTKAQFIAAVQTGKLPYKSVSATERVAVVSAKLGVTRGTIHLVVGEMHLTGTYLAAWALRDGRWQLLDWQSTPPLQAPAN